MFDITDIKIRLVNADSKLKAVASIVITTASPSTTSKFSAEKAAISSLCRQEKLLTERIGTSFTPSIPKRAKSSKMQFSQNTNK